MLFTFGFFEEIDPSYGENELKKLIQHFHQKLKENNVSSTPKIIEYNGKNHILVECYTFSEYLKPEDLLNLTICTKNFSFSVSYKEIKAHSKIFNLVPKLMTNIYN